MIDPNELVGVTDAHKWANVWAEQVKENPDIATSEGTMLAWFSVAIMAGYDAGVKHEKQRDILDRIHEIVYTAVGAGTGVMLSDNPEYIFPAERVKDVVADVLSDFGIPKTKGYS